MSNHPWIKFYPRDWRGDQALRVVSLAARGLWMEMLCVMHEATPYGHLVVGAQPVTNDTLSRLTGASLSEVQAMLVELQNAEVLRKTRTGVIYSKRMVADHKRAEKGRKDKLAALREVNETKDEKPDPSRVPPRPPRTQKPDTRGKLEGPKDPSNLTGRVRSEARRDGASDDRSTVEGKTLEEIKALIFGPEDPPGAEIIELSERVAR